MPSRPRTGHKFNAKPTVVDGVRFASKKEARRWAELVLLWRTGEIRDVELQPTFPIFAVGLLPVPERDEVPILPAWVSLRKCGRYTADFAYTVTATGERVIEDVKASATATEAYRLRKKLVEATYGIVVREV